MEKIDFNISWSFWKKELNWTLFKNFWNKKLLINIHWLYWSWKWTDSKYENFCEKLWKNNICSSVFYASSRLDINYDDNLWKFENKQRKFTWKTFKNELEDAENIIKYFLENSEIILWVKSEELEIILNWNSLWWIISFYMAEKFKKIKKISSVWTWAFLDLWKVPIISTLDETNIFLEKVKNFNWFYFMNESWDDDIFTKESYDLLFSSAKNSKKERFLFEWVDHSFKKLNWEKSEIPYNKIYKNILKLIKS